MMRPSLSLIITFVFTSLILHSVYNLISLYSNPTCKPDEVCYSSYLNKNPNLELLVYVSDKSNVNLVLHLEKFDYHAPLERNIEIEISPFVRNNGSLHIHTVVIPERIRKGSISVYEAKSLPDSTYFKNKLTKYSVPKSSTFNLLQEESKKSQLKPVAHLKTKFAIIMCNEELHIPHHNAPFELLKYLRINNRRQFLPIASQDILQTRLRDLQEITRDMKYMNFSYIYTPTSMGKFKFLVQMEGTLLNFMQLGFTENDVDEVKSVFADTNLYLLCATMVIGGVHLLLDFLSFKNDVSFWRSHKSMAGLSVRTVLWRSFSQTIIFLYLLDEGTSLLVLIPSGIGMFIEFWKIKKVFKISITLSGIKFNNNLEETAVEAKTKQYDRESMKYLSYVLYPLVICAAAYSLLYQPHKSWYSWTINSMVNGVYVFGFLFMLPQLFINYRLKSVAALPWRAFTYRAFNTFIDDIFAFIITMPTAHRIACFRDDVVFIIYLYQRWLYPVDTTRVDDGTGVLTEEIEDKKTK